MFAGGVDTSATETKGTVLIHSAEQVCLEGIAFFVALYMQCCGIYLLFYETLYFIQKELMKFVVALVY